MNFDLYPSALSLDGTEKLVISQGGFTRDLTLNLVSAFAMGSKSAVIVVTNTVAPTANTALALTADTNIVSVCPVGGGVRLPGKYRDVVVNRGANSLTVYPPVGGTIEGQATQFILPGGSATFVSADLINFYAI